MRHVITSVKETKVYFCLLYSGYDANYYAHCGLQLCMHAACIQFVMVTYERERDRQFFSFFPTDMLPW